MINAYSSNEDIRAYYYNFNASLTDIAIATNLTPEEANLIVNSED
jgi:hypothetical protein